MTTIETLLMASIELAKQRKLIVALQSENALLRQRLNTRSDFDLSADENLRMPALLRRQI